MPSLKITPFSGMNERSTSDCPRFSFPNTNPACDVRLVNGSRTAKYSSSASHGSRYVSGAGGVRSLSPAWLIGIDRGIRPVVGSYSSVAFATLDSIGNVNPAVTRNAPVTIDCSQPVDPAPVDTITPLDD